MRVSLIKKNKIQGLILPDQVFGSYWITDTDDAGNDRNLISVEAHDNKWRIVSNDNTFCVSKEKVIPYVEIKEYSFVLIKNIEYINGKKVEGNMLLYVAPSFEDYKVYDIGNLVNAQIKIGSSKDSNIIYSDSSFLSDFAYLQNVNGKYVLICNGTSYINNRIAYKRQELYDGDVIFMMGLKIILAIKGDKKYLMINNPNGKVTATLPIVKDDKNEIGKVEIIDDNEVYMPLYTDEDYYHKNPRFETKIDDYVINVDSPPEPNNQKETPLLLTIAPMLMMSMTSMFSGYMAINAVHNGNATILSAVPSILMCVAMLSSAIIWPVVTRKYNAQEKKKYEAERQEKYSKYIQSKSNEIKTEITVQRTKLIDMYPPTDVCQNTILNKMTRLWERRITDEDFLAVNLGLGTIPMNIKINWPDEHFSMAEDSLKKTVDMFLREPKVLENVPVKLSFLEKNKVAVIGHSNVTINYTKQLLLQLFAYHSYDDLRIVIFTNNNNKDYWKFTRLLPYIWSNDRSIRYFAESTDEYKELCYNLDSILNKRLEDKEKSSKSPHYLIITDSIKSIRNFDFIKRLVSLEDNLGFSFLVLNEKITNLPEQFKTFVNVSENGGQLVLTTANTKPISFAYDNKVQYDYDRCAKVLANLPVELTVENKESELPNSLGFLEMYDVGKVEQLNSYNRWNSSNPILSLHAPVGVGTNDEKIELDLHEKYHGPHGLIAGMTGSGKSEFIITYILSMALNYHPYEVQFILIDYKGGGLAGAFKNKNYRLPHLVGTITNLDTTEINRSLASIESELKRRQRAFNVAREISGDSTIDIYKYQKLYRDGVVKEPISHLFIISDEFAELKSERQEFMAQLIQTARIGRSLGVHLILATQKPSGVVDSQIWSNTRFRVCLRVQETSDSSEVIKRPDAAYLKQTGRFYLQVGQNEIYALGQAAWAGGKYYPSEKIVKKTDSDLNVINNIGYVIKSSGTTRKNAKLEAKGEEITNIVKYLNDIAKKFNIQETQLWLDRIPNEIFVTDLIEKYNYKEQEYTLEPVVGEYDDPHRQLQKVLTLPLTKEGNALIYGASGSGKENFISTLIYSLMINHTPEEVNVYAIDCGANTLKMYQKSPIVGDIVGSDDNEKISNLFKLVNNLVEERKKLFADYNGDYLTYLRISKKKLPALVIALNDYENFRELYEDYEDTITDITRDSNKYGIYFVITASTPNGIRFKLKQNFRQIFVLNQNNTDDYSSILGNVNKEYPSKNFGRGIVKWDKVYEFQTAMPTTRSEISKFVSEEIAKYASKYPNKAMKIPVLPETVSYKDIASSFGKNNNLIVGINKDSLGVCEYNYRKNLLNLVLAQETSQTYLTIKPIISELLCFKDLVEVFNCDDYELDENYKKYMLYYNNDFDSKIDELFNYVDNAYQKYVNNNYNIGAIKDIKHRTLLIISLDNLFSRISLDSQDKFKKLLEEAKNLDILNVIIFDNSTGIHKYELDSWFKNSANQSEGIWIGNGVNDQYTIKIAKRINDMRLEIEDNYAFVVRKGKPVLVKLLEQFDLKFKN